MPPRRQVSLASEVFLAAAIGAMLYNTGAAALTDGGHKYLIELDQKLFTLPLQ